MNITGNGAGLSFGGGAAVATTGQTEPVSSSANAAAPGSGGTMLAPMGMSLGLGAALFKNMESYPGQIAVTPPKFSARQEGKMARRDAVRAARHAERTSEHIRGGLDRKADMAVGVNLRVIAEPDWDALGLYDKKKDWEKKKPFAQACQREFNNWANDSRLLQDAEGHYNFGGMMWMAYRNLIGPDAECAGVIHYDEARMARYNARWATFVQIIDPDRIETPPEFSGDDNVYEGKRLDEWGRAVGFYVSRAHPAEGAANASQVGHAYVPRETPWGRAIGFHFFTKTRAGQMRGVTNLVTVLRKTNMLDSFDDAYLGAAVVNQVLSSYVETMASPDTVAQQLAPAGQDQKSPFESKLAYYDKAKIRIGGTRIPVMPPGDKVMMSAVNRAIGDPSQFRNGFLREFASAIGISFEQLSQNFSDANYSAARAALLEVWRGILSQRRLFTAHVATLIYAAVIEEAIARGRIELPAGAPPFQENRAAYTACRWTGPGMGWIDPAKEMNAIEKALQLKIRSRSQVVAEVDGSDYLETFDQIEQEQMEAEERGFTLDPPPPGSPEAAADGEDAAETNDDGPPAPKRKGPRDGDGDGQVQERQNAVTGRYRIKELN